MIDQSAYLDQPYILNVQAAAAGLRPVSSTSSTCSTTTTVPSSAAVTAAATRSCGRRIARSGGHSRRGGSYE